jgi:predicted lipid-binding transport protein (Tim44 family)
MLGGLAAGFLGAGLLGMLFGGGLSGLGGLSSIIGLMLQLVLIYFVVRFVMSWWQRRNASSYAHASAAPVRLRSRIRARWPMRARASALVLAGSNDAPLEIKPDDYDVRTAARRSSDRVVERGHRQAAHAGDAGNGFVFHRGSQREQAARRDQQGVGRQAAAGRPREAWREGTTDYATWPALQPDRQDHRARHRQDHEGSDAPQEVTDVWTFVRRPGSQWELSAIQPT